MEPPFSVENEIEARIVADADWQEGVGWGEPRQGHPEGSVAAHIAEVLENVDRHEVDPEGRRKLRVVALIHDTFKHQVEYSRPRSGENHHATLARRFAERYIDDPGVLELIELHDEAYNSWAAGARTGDWDAAEERARRLVIRLGESLPLYLRFYRADNETGSKSQEPLEWFERVLVADKADGRSEERPSASED